MNPLCVNDWMILQSTCQDSIILTGCVEPLVVVHPTDRPDLHHTSPGDAGPMGCTKTYKHVRRLYLETNSSLHRHLLTWFSPPPAHLPLSLYSCSLTVLALWKVQSCQGECQTTCVEQSAKHTHTDIVPHTHSCNSHLLSFFPPQEVERHLTHFGLGHSVYHQN